MTHSVWISRKEVEQLTGWTKRTVLRKQASGELKNRPAQRVGNGKPAREYSAASLPADAQLKLMELKMAAGALVPVKQSITAVPTLPEPKSDKVVRALESLDDEARAQAQQRLKVLAPMIDFVNRTNGYKPLFRAASGEEFTSLSSIILHLVDVTGYSERTIREWWKRYKNDGPGALTDRARSDAGKSRFFQQHTE
jgi:hypothetical protein